MNISVVIPTYRRPLLLGTCLQSIIAQSLDCALYEVIVVSDGPDEATRTVVEQYNSGFGGTIHGIALGKKKGPAAARNRGWRMAKGLLVAFTDDDCIADRDWLHNIWKEYNHQDYIAYTGKVIVPVSAAPTDYEMNTAGLQHAEFITANCAISKKALEALGGFDESFKAAWREDSDLQFRLMERHIPICTAGSAIITHPVRQSHWGVSIREQKKGIYNALLYKKFPKMYRSKINHPQWNYYLIILSFFLTMGAGILSWPVAGWLAGTTWLFLTAGFMFKRIRHTRKSPGHIWEMALTSLVIPFISVYYTLYGAVKYRVVFF